MTSLRTFIIATDCSSVNPSSCNFWTNFNVSKWCSLLRAGEAWKARRRLGCWRGEPALLKALFGSIREEDLPPCIERACTEAGHGRWLLVCVAAIDALARGCCPNGAVQLSRGRRNLGTIWVVEAIVGRAGRVRLGDGRACSSVAVCCGRIALRRAPKSHALEMT